MFAMNITLIRNLSILADLQMWMQKPGSIADIFETRPELIWIPRAIPPPQIMLSLLSLKWLKQFEHVVFDLFRTHVFLMSIL